MKSKISEAEIKRRTMEWMRGYSTARKHITSIEDWLSYGEEVKASKYYKNLTGKK